ncbi:hypothetical protein [Paenibacillus sp. S150]|uniref:hypothetical protein n=1 Tax=Paenibacillus sp. S150 TaxID=2749826 RepID=UPI001C577020|nr:hypothetical protein [Paenibacillus sp. S150]MBW4081529.1 hypothetical protein [Paenibacillus sp. S150]
MRNHAFYEKLDRKNSIWMIGLLIVTALSLLIFVFGPNLQEFYSQVYTLGLEEQFFLVILLLLISILLIFGMIHILTLFYFSKDIEALLPLPLRPIHILASKFIVVLTGQYIVFFIGIGIAAVLYGIQHQPGFLFYLNACMIVIFLPLPFIAVISLFCFVLMRVLNLSKYKEIVQIAASVVILVTPFLIRRLFNLSTLSRKDYWFSDALRVVSRSFFHYQSPVYLLIIASTSLVALLLFAVAGEKLYFKGVIGNNEGSGKGSRTPIEASEKIKVAYAYIRNEIRSYLRTPVFVINCILKNSLWTLVLLVVLGSQWSTIKLVFPYIEGITDSLNGRIIFMILAVIYLQVGQNYSSAIAFSKDGTRIMNSKYIPVGYPQQIMYRVLASAAVLIVPSMILLIVALTMLQIPLLASITAVLLMIPASLSGAMLGVLADIHNPKLFWDSEAGLVKNNWNIFSGTLFAIGMFILLVLISRFYNPSFVSAVLICLLGSCAINICLYALIRRTGEAKVQAMLDS